MIAIFIILFFISILVFPLLIYLFVREEHNKREKMDRQKAEKTARRDTKDKL